MNESLIALLSIAVGVLGAVLTPKFTKKTFNFTTNTIIGVFGSVFFVKMLSKFISPFLIVKGNTINYKLLTLNFIVSFIGAVIAVLLLKMILYKLNKKSD